MKSFELSTKRCYHRSLGMLGNLPDERMLPIIEDIDRFASDIIELESGASLPSEDCAFASSSSISFNAIAKLLNFQYSNDSHTL